MKAIEEQVLGAIERERQKSFDLNAYIHQNPELGYGEFLAAKKYVELLRAEGMAVEENYLGNPTAFRATICEDPASDIKIAILAEYDALPEIGHACGHSASGALSFLAALGLYHSRDQLGGNIWLVGTPAEEVGGAKIKMADSGLYNDFSYVIMIHMADSSQSYSHTLALNAYRFEFTGRTAHTAICPWEGRNAGNGMALFTHALDMMRQHLRDGARIHGIMHEGGTAINIVPEKAVCSYMWRYTGQAYMDELTEMILNAAECCAKATQTTVEYTPMGTLAALRPTPRTDAVIAGIYGELGIGEAPFPAAPFGSSDIGQLSCHCPAMQPIIAVTDSPTPIHTPAFAACMPTDKTRWAIEQGAKAIATLVVRSLYDPAIIAGMRADFEGA